MLDTAMKPPPLAAEAERVFRHFNKHLFGNGLPSPIFTIAFSKRFGVKFRPDTFEFALGSSIETWTPERFVCEVLHEMVHFYNNQRGVTDCTSNQYHNQEFVAIALEVGFFVCKHRTRGMACSSFERPDACESLREPTKAANDRLLSVLSKLKFDGNILKYVQKSLRSQRKATPSKTFLVKWVCKCPPPHNCIRSGRRPDGPNPLKIRCEACKAMFTADKEE